MENNCPNSSIGKEILKRSFKVSANISLVLFIAVGILLFAAQLNQHQRLIQQKLDIDSELIVNSLKIGDLFFIKKYLSSFVDSGAVDACGIKKSDDLNWLGIAPAAKFEDKLSGTDFALGILSTTVRGVYTMVDLNQNKWLLHYTYSINHFFLVYVAVAAFIISLINFVFLNKTLKDTASFFSEPVENLNKDMDSFAGNPSENFIPYHYKNGRQFFETDRFVEELNHLLLKISKQKDRIKEAEIHKALNQLSRQVNHDVQSPLGALKTAVGQIDSNKEVALNLIQRSVDRIQSIVSDLKIRGEEIGSIPVDWRRVDLNEFIQNIVAEKNAEYSGKVDVKFKPFDGDLFINVDHSGLSRALSNILNNGIEAVKEGRPEIVLKVTDDTSFAVVSISDNGIGIPEPLRGKVFEYGFSTSNREGAGTGLSHASQVIRRHGGSISVIDNRDGKGVKLVLTLRK